ncbi:hypothetical protein B484DRAFT_228921 [Ochromonadaceae sp. CCMP2298]|nr:hypothetical protein B484DRAFT_228921 [Ochromonadaceae sp. CCMP2298]
MGFMLKASENAHEATVLANPDLYLRRVQSAIVAPGRGLPAFQWGALLDLELSGRHLSDKTMAVLFQGLGADRLIRRVRSLKLASNLIKDLALKALLIAYFPNVHMADDSCRFDEYMLVSEMDPDIDLMVLDLSNNRIDEFGVPYLMDLLRMCCSLMTFSVASNNLDEFLCAELVRCLARPKEDFEEDVESTYAVSYGYAGAKLDLKVHNSSITDANFGHNVFGQAAADELTNMLKNNAVLRSLSLEHSPAIEPSMWKPILTALRLYNSVLEELVLSDNRLSVKTAQYIGRVFESKDTQVNKLILSNCGLSHKHMTALCDPLAQSSTLTYLDISNNKIGDKGCEFLALVVGQGDESKGPPLHTLDFSGCSFGSAGCAELLEAVATRKLLPRLDLSSNGFGAENSAGVKALLQCRVTDLRLHCCGLRSGTASAIFTALAQQGTQCLLASSVRSLGLSGNEISDSAAEALCLLLMHNRVLELLDLGFNELTDQKQPLFLQATRITSTSADFKKVLGLTVSLQGNKCDPYMLDTPGMSRAKANLLFGLRPGETDAAHRGFSHVTSYSRAHFLARKQLDEYYQQSLPSMELNHIT